jgi:hypothetical protein
LERACFTPQNLRTRKSIDISRTRRKNDAAVSVIGARVVENKALDDALVGTTRVPATSSGKLPTVFLERN